MAITVTRARVKEKCSLTVATYDASIDALLLEFLPAIEFSVRPEVLASSEAGVVATLNLAAAEIVAGEVMAQLLRIQGATGVFGLGELAQRPAFVDLADPFGLAKQGWKRLAPFVKALPKQAASGGISTASKVVLEESA
jgi:hypothetical protein